ncbi:hypothetical protein GYMLUDRAFT_44733 [Collybiopsis luxurians FD-317 M1]|uniref:Uncharacterized protein n=1 Tax=Collybiopsis luxurians FD-317 M1 TaxID=944289 RepID=A0A0D0CLF3_9AGAR|nr:hypothetical protein GYMLUDRAFT_44733 [Collybiopsis luxurians FD-317 M1]
MPSEKQKKLRARVLELPPLTDAFLTELAKRRGTWYKQRSVVPLPSSPDLYKFDKSTVEALQRQFPGQQFKPTDWARCAASDQGEILIANKGSMLCIVWFTRIERARHAKSDAKAHLVLMSAETVIALTPGRTKTPCSMVFPAKTMSPETLATPFTDGSDAPYGFILDPGVEVDYMLSYWEAV